MNNIYVAGPNIETNTAFINKVITIPVVKEIVIETQKMEIPEDFQVMYIILDETEESIIWQRFYFENSENEKIKLVKNFR